MTRRNLFRRHLGRTPTYPMVRLSTTCPLCAGAKSVGFLTCDTCVERLHNDADYLLALEKLRELEAFLARPITTREIVGVA